MSRHFLVTGGGGFIGSHIVRGLLSRGDRVRVLDDFSGCGSWRRLVGLDAIERIHGSVLDREVLRHAVAGVDVIFHKAALISVPESVRTPLPYHHADGKATLLLLKAARKAGVKRGIYASTSAIYGDEPLQPKVESMRGLPLSLYGIAKYAGELYMSAYFKLHNVATISLRYFNVFGSGQDPKSVYGAAIPRIVTKILSGISPTIYGDGEQTRDFCHVSNIKHANLLAADASQLSGEVVISAAVAA